MWASSAERIESSRAAADLEKSQALGTAVIAERCNPLMPAMRNASATS
jgi:hypothetical protein